MSFKVLSLDPVNETMVIDWGSQVLNHYIPRQIMDNPTLDRVGIQTIIERVRPKISDSVDIPDALLALVEVPTLDDAERRWRDELMLPLLALRDRHRDQETLGIATNLSSEQFKEALVYIQALRDWPQSEAFPATEHRPSPPTWLAEQTQ